MRLIILPILLSYLAAAQNTALAPETGTGSIEGTVLSAEGSPLANATVYALPRRGVHPGLISLVKTDELGKFRIDGVKPGETVVYAYDLEEATWIRSPH